MNFNFTEWAIRRRSLVTCSIAVMVVGVGSYLWLGRSAAPAFIFPAIGIALAVCLAAEEMIRLRDHPARRNPSVETKGKADA